MSRTLPSIRSAGRVLRLAAALTLVAGVLATATAGASSAPVRARPAGPTGDPLVLYDGAYLRAHDVLVDSDGTTYIAWSTTEGTTYLVHSCRIALGEAECLGGIQSVASPGDARQLEMVEKAGGGAVVLVLYDTVDSVLGPMGAELATSYLPPVGAPEGLSFWAEAPSFGTLLDTSVILGELTAVVAPQAGTSSVHVYDGPSSRTEVTTPYPPGEAAIAANPGTGAVLAVSEYGSIDEPVQATAWAGEVSPDFTKVRGTWNIAGFGMVKTGRGVELVASDNNASYETVLARWKDGGFSDPRRTGIGARSCAATSHDLGTDPSGRLVDTFFTSCGVGVANLPQGGAAGVTSFKPRGTPHATPQVATNRRGTGWVAWVTEGDSDFDVLRAVPIVLPAAIVSTSRSASFGRARLDHPQNCLPPVDARVGLSAKGLNGWDLRDKRLTLDGNRVDSPLKGGALAAGSEHDLVGLARFAKGGEVRTLRLAEVIRACPAV